MINITFRDVLMLTVMCFMAFVLWMLPHLNPPADQDKKIIDPPGNFNVSIAWPDGEPDVDVWIKAPGDDGPVGFTAMNGKQCNLTRDDLGRYLDFGKSNFENIFCRGLLAGSYTVNLHCFACYVSRAGQWVMQPVPVEVRITARDEHGNFEWERQATVTLRRNKQELTVVRFKLDRSGNIVPGSENNVFKSIIGQGRTP